MENQENITNISQIEQREEEAPQQTNLMASEQIQNVSDNVAPIDTESASIPEQDSDRKLFVGGLPRETTEDDLRTYFAKYGTIDSVELKINLNSQIFEGFAFIVFNSTEAITNVNTGGEHIINNKRVDVQLTKSKKGKIYVGRVTSELSEEDIKNHFGQFGNVLEVQMPFDNVRNQRQNFCFVFFDSEDVVENLLKTPKVSIKGVEVDVKKAIYKPYKCRQNPVPQTLVGQNYGQLNFDGQNWNSNQIYGTYGDSQQPSGNIFGVYTYPGYGGIQSYAGNTEPNRDNITRFTPGAGRGREGRGAGRGTMRGANNAGMSYGAGNVGENFKYQPY